MHRTPLIARNSILLLCKRAEKINRRNRTENTVSCNNIYIQQRRRIFLRYHTQAEEYHYSRRKTSLERTSVETRKQGDLLPPYPGSIGSEQLQVTNNVKSSDFPRSTFKENKTHETNESTLDEIVEPTNEATLMLERQTRHRAIKGFQ